VKQRTGSPRTHHGRQDALPHPPRHHLAATASSEKETTAALDRVCSSLTGYYVTPGLCHSALCSDASDSCRAVRDEAKVAALAPRLAARNATAVRLRSPTRHRRACRCTPAPSRLCGGRRRPWPQAGTAARGRWCRRRSTCRPGARASWWGPPWRGAAAGERAVQRHGLRRARHPRVHGPRLIQPLRAALLDRRPNEASTRNCNRAELVVSLLDKPFSTQCNSLWMNSVTEFWRQIN
jgi:hypothetical protein